MNQYKVFWLSRTISFFGDYVFSITMVWFALQSNGIWGVTGAVSTAVVSRMIGSIVFAPLVNIFGSRKIIICTDLLRGFVMLAFWLLAILGSQNVILLSLLVGLNMFFAGGFEVALQSFIPTISDELRKANADLSTGRNFVQLIGLLSGGILMEMYFGLGFFLISFMIVQLIKSWKSLLIILQNAQGRLLVLGVISII
ncbi:hypothetical protein ACUIAK_14295 [Bacillus cytotoxicus]